jgi:hypothetical protein
VTGHFADTVNFAADWGGTDSKTGTGISTDIFVTRINANGTYGWTKRMGDTAFDYADGICTDGGGNVYVTGHFADTVNFAADWGGTDSKTGTGISTDIFVTRINANGTYGWTKRMGGTAFDYADGICTDGGGNVYMTGHFADTVNFREDWGGTDSRTGTGISTDIFVTRINANGTYGWTKRMGGPDFDYVYGICTDGGGNVYVTGYFSSTVNFAADWGGTDSKTGTIKVLGDTTIFTIDVFVTKINANGTYGWTKRMGGPDNDYVQGICTDGSGNVYVTGYFSSTVNFREDWGGTDSRTGTGISTDIFVTKIVP